ncbi:MAG: PAS domain S-box protein [Gemmatimonadetes bacterium]|jgi:PAS domain S-box-containing protein|nr:PAS domain S-box protein [Gemmatimonadota bacterium]MBT6144497.1 PAS domain S-box protein [Gemmatimonadota bacterium]MBT7862019.1 PAS domain S-box protein [Gemmatimonadota bacterium]
MSDPTANNPDAESEGVTPPDSAALQDLALSEARYRALVEGSTDFIYVLDTEGRFTFANGEVGHLLGYSPEEVIGRHYTEVLHPEDVDRVGRAFHERRTGDRASRRMEVRLRSRGGATRDVEMDVRHFSVSAHGLYRGTNFVGTHGVARDITERKYQEDKRLVMQQVREGVWSMTKAEEIHNVLEAIRTGLDDMGVAYQHCAVNVVDSGEPSMLRTYSSFGSEGLTKRGEWMVTDVENYASRAFRIWRRGIAVHRTDLLRLDPAKELPLLIEHFGELRSAVDTPFSHGTLTVTHTMADSFSERDLAFFVELAEVLSEGFRRADDLQQMAGSERRYRTLVETPDFVVMLLDPEGSYLYVSPQIEGWLGYAPSDFYQDADLGTSIVHPEDSSTLTELLASGGGADHHTEFRWRHKAGHFLWAAGSIFPIYEHPEDEQIHRVAMYQIVVQDITERKLAQDTIQASLEEKEVLLKEIHHRVKNNLQIISSLLHLQASRLEDTSLGEAFDDSQHRIRSMALIHEELYKSEDLARIDFPAYAQRLIENLFDSFGPSVRGVEHETDMDAALMTIDQAIPLGLVVNELLSNALKYAFPSNTGMIRLQLRNHTDSLELIVSDNGIGLPDHLLNEGLENPTTLGLKLVISLVGQIRGDLSATSDEGTTFTITLPVNDED